MNSILGDLRYGWRLLLKNRGFTLAAVLSLALGIGANTAMFSVVNAVLLRTLPFPDPDRLVMIWEDASFAGFPRNTPAPANYADWKSQNQTFEEVAAINREGFDLTGNGEPQSVQAYAVTANFFPTLGVRPILGRVFLSEDDNPQANKVVVLSYRLWQSRYGGEQSIIGREILLNGEKYAVIGVMPASFQFLESYIALWVPAAYTPEVLARRGSHFLHVVGRIKPGVTFEQANADIQGIQAQIARDYPNEAGRVTAFILPLREQFAGDLRRPLLVLLVAVGFVLLIACANIANLLLSRAASRQREIAVRSALGASRWRIVRQLLSESLVLSSIGAPLSILFALWSFAFLEHLIPDTLKLSAKLSLDLPVLGYTLLVSLITAIVFGLAPALQASKLDLNQALKQSAGRAGTAIGGKRLRSAMVVAEVALALVLLVGAGLLIQTFLKLREQYSGLQPENVLTMRTVLGPNKYRDLTRRAAFYDQVLERVKALPGVITAGFSTTVPLEWKGGTSGFRPEGLTAEEAQATGLSYDANHRQVTTDYINAIGMPVIKGRYFDAGDTAQSMPVAIVNQTMARQYFGDDAIGKRMRLGRRDSGEPWITIVGVVGDVRQMGVDEPVKAEMYFPFGQITSQPWFSPRDLALRTSVDPSSLAGAVVNAIHEVDPDQPVANIRTMEEILGEQTAPRRLGMTLLTIFAGVALLLAALGIYSVLAYFVVQHTAEIGVRLALGSPQGSIIKLVVKRGMSLALTGVAIGLLATYALTRLMASLLFGVSATDPLTFGLIAGLLALVALAACYLPARRASRLDPLAALRCE
ncbi:MAG TPA: ABC transporter permease [Blastocatellia bacterium]|nr:ABC transporter permease [Blastocatellia bacterium]